MQRIAYLYKSWDVYAIVKTDYESLVGTPVITSFTKIVKRSALNTKTEVSAPYKNKPKPKGYFNSFTLSECKIIWFLEHAEKNYICSFVNIKGLIC